MKVFSKQYSRWLLLISILAMCTGIGLLSVQAIKPTPSPTATGNALLTIQGFQSVVYNDKFRLKISGNFLTIAPLKLFGPFRLGFAYVLTIRDATLETFSTEQDFDSFARQPDSLTHITASLTQSLNRLSIPLLPDRNQLAITAIVCEPLRIVRQDSAYQKPFFAATSCRLTPRTQKVVCQNGAIHDGLRELSFRTLSYDGRRWQLRGSDGQSRRADTLRNLLG